MSDPNLNPPKTQICDCHNIRLEYLKGKIEGIKITKTLALVWIGEKTKPKIVGLGRGIEIIVKCQHGRIVHKNYVEVLAKFSKPIELQKLPLECVVYGGVTPTPMKIINYGKMNRDIPINKVKEIFGVFGEEYNVIVPSGVGCRTWFIVGKKITGMEEIHYEGIVTDPPYKYHVVLHKSKEIFAKKISGP